MSRHPRALIRRRLMLLAAAATAGLVALTGAPTSANPTAAPDRAVAAPAQYVVTGAEDFTDVDAVARTGAAVDEIDHGKIYITATAAEVRTVRALGFTVEPAPAHHHHDDGAEPYAFPPGYQGYHDYDELEAVVDQLVSSHPGIAQRHSFGTSYEGRDLIAVKISDNVGVDEGEPEILYNAGQHAREHLTVEMAVYLLRMFIEEYGSSSRVTDLVDNRVIWILPNVNPDGAEYDIATGSFRSWRKNRQPNPGSPYVGTDLNRNWGHQWGGGGASSNPASSTYRGSAPFSATEVDQLRQFVQSRVIDGEQRITANIDFHTYSELVLWPYGYTYSDLAPGMDADAHDTFTTIGNQLAQTNGYTPMQASDLYIASGVSIDWMWYDQGIFSYTFEMYPASGSGGGFYPPDSVIDTQTARNREASLLLAEYADCPWRAIGKEAEYCGSGGGDETTVFYDDFSTSTGWTLDPYGDDTATTGVWERGAPQATSWQGTTLQLDTPVAGSNTLVTGRLAGSSAGAYDIDGGATTARSPQIALPADGDLTLSLSYYLAHLSNSSSADHLRVSVEHAGGSTTVLDVAGSGSNRSATWSTATADLTPYAGQTVRLVVRAADAAGGSLVEAAIDDVHVTATS